LEPDRLTREEGFVATVRVLATFVVPDRKVRHLLRVGPSAYALVVSGVWLKIACLQLSSYRMGGLLPRLVPEVGVLKRLTDLAALDGSLR
jgi:hypothetical protein